ncbi:MAG TPA: AAA family ATPase, partial [Acidimicrobiales bacterium]|nr:AAA family ATPase [Acidimicrobiales bacterium]
MFDAAAANELSRRAPLAARMRPKNLDEFVGQRHLLAPGATLRALIETDRLSSAIFFGPAGSGKTTLAQIIASTTKKVFVTMSATSAGVKEVREVLEEANRELGMTGRGTILFLDEIHRFSKTQQDALLPGVESGIVVLIGATTENPFFSLTSPLLSRSTLWRFEPIGRDELAELGQRAVDDEKAVIDDDALAACCDLAD